MDRKVEEARIKKPDGRAVVAGSLQLKEKDTSCSGWDQRRDMTV